MPVRRLALAAGAAPFAFVCLQLAAASAQAGMLGTSATLRYDLESQSSFDSVVVGDGIEVLCPGDFNVCAFLTIPNQTVDFGDLSISYAINGNTGGFTGVTPNGFRFLDLNPGFAIGGVMLTSTIAGLDMSRVSFTANSVSLEVGGLPLVDGTGFTVTLLPVPEPATALLATVGGLMLAGVARRRAAAASG